MAPKLSFPWLQDLPDWQDRARAALALENPAAKWQELQQLANSQMDMLRTARLDLMLDKAFPTGPGGTLAQTVKLSLLGESNGVTDAR